jgi:hypothetical protein
MPINKDRNNRNITFLYINTVYAFEYEKVGQLRTLARCPSSKSDIVAL